MNMNTSVINPAPSQRTLKEPFGTDGVRGTVNQGVITPEGMMSLALAAARWVQDTEPLPTGRPMVIIAKDTRLSGYMVETAMTSGFLAMGFDVKQLGPMPTPALARLTRSMRAQLGVMITASHNPYVDNGVKLFTGEGFKLSDAEQAAILSRWKHLQIPLCAAEDLGRARRLEDAPGRYIEMLKADIPPRFSLPRLKVVVDCANGAAYRVAPLVLHELGVDVVAIHVAPDGTNINRNCGAMHVREIAKATQAHRADMGLAFDGDGDRLIVADAQGQIYDGDAILVILAQVWQTLAAHSFRIPATYPLTGAVGTSQTNSGVAHFCERQGLTFVRSAQVGDRYVKEAMLSHAFPLGTEPSGHILMGAQAAVGDALAAAIAILSGIAISKCSLTELAAAYQPLPTQRRNVRFGHPDQVARIVQDAQLTEAVKAARHEIGKSGRVELRAAGTEPVVRLFVETEHADMSLRIADQLEAAIVQNIRT